jgi:ABC-2 type transport system ATP-binding protein
VTAGGGPDSAAGIVVRGLCKNYAGRAVVDGLDLDVPPGTIGALLGPNGAGKTTTVEILEGYREADAGQVRVLGLDPARDGRALRGRLGLMLQGGGIYPLARAGEIVRLYARFYRQPLDPEELLERVGLREVADTRYRVLSGGQRQRLGLALAIVGRPELVILDEPTAGMDPAAKTATRELIGSLRERGVTVLLTTHELADVERLADGIAIVDRGRIVARGSLAELTAGSAARLRFRLGASLGEPERAALEAAILARVGGPRSELRDGAGSRTVRLVSDGSAAAYRVDGIAPDPWLVSLVTAWSADRGLIVSELRTTGATLEERYLELTGAGAGADAA